MKVPEARQIAHITYMPRLYKAAIFVALSSTALAVVLLTNVVSDKRAHIALPNLALDLGKGKSGELLSGTFAIRNMGTRPLEYDIAASCSCSFLDPCRGTVPPMDSAEIRVGIRIPEDVEQKVVNLQISSNDPTRPTTAYSVRAQRLTEYVVSPPYLNFGRINPGIDKRLQFTVRGPGGRPLKMPGSVQAVSTSNTVQIERDRDPGYPVFSVSLRKGMSEGLHRSLVRISSPEISSIVDVPVVAEFPINNSCIVVPNTVFLTKDMSTGKYVDTKFIVMRTGSAMHPEDQILGPVKDIRVPEGLTVSENSGKGRIRAFAIHSENESFSWKSSCIRLSFHDLEQDIILQIKCVEQ
jgi:hypothetical protein